MNNQKKLKRLVIFYETNCGGETIVTKDFLKEIKNRKNIVVNVCKLSALEKTDTISFFGWLSSNIFKSVAYLINNRNIDSVYTTTYTAGVAASLFKLFIPIKIYFHYHGDRVVPMLAHKNIFKRLVQKVKYKVSYILHSYFLNKVEFIITPSGFAREYLNKLFNKSFDPKIFIIENGIDLKKFGKISSSELIFFQKYLDVSKENRVLLYAGRLEKDKNLLTLVRVFQLVQRQHKEAVLVIAFADINSLSERHVYLELVDEVKKLNLVNKVIFAKGQKIRNLYSASDLVISLSKKETFSLPMLEAFASKKLCVSSRTGAANSFLGKIDKRLIIEITNNKEISQKILNVINLPKNKKDELVDKGYKLATSYSIKRMTDKTLSLMNLH